MKVEHNVDLSKYTTFHIGGVADCFYIPESIQELVEILKTLDSMPYILSGGSNLLINDNKRFEHVIFMQECNKKIEHLGDGLFSVGASVRIQDLIKCAMNEGFGGIEFLYSLPAMLGGIVYMNAGTGRSAGESISNYIISVTYLYNGKEYEISAEQCDFGFRQSYFQKCPECIILEVKLKLEKKEEDQIKQAITKRMEYASDTQDRTKYNFGTLFCEKNPYILAFVRLITPKKEEGVHFSSKKKSTIVNGGKGTYKEAMSIINNVIKMHKLFGKKCKVEVQIWD